MSIAGHRNERGVTLLEMILVMVLIGILSSIIIVPVITAAKAWNEMSLQKEAVDQARIGLDRFVRELRAIQRVNGRPSIVTIGPSSIRFVRVVRDLNEDELEYSWAGAGQPLVRTVWKKNVSPTPDTATPDTAALTVQSFNLTYYEDSNASLTQFRQEAEGAPSPPMTCSPTPACTATTDPNASNGQLVLLDAAVQSSVTYGFTGTRVAWIGPKNNTLGIANVQVAGTDVNGQPIPPAIVNQYAGALATLQPLFVSPELNYATHTIMISFSATSSPGTTVAVDAFDRLVSRVVVNLTVGIGTFTTDPCTSPPNTTSNPFSCLRDQVSFRSVD
jgi:prepilin-type N-terminal cleavage/methylation domain-containing protein